MNEPIQGITSKELQRHIIGALRTVKPGAVDKTDDSLPDSLLLGADLGLSSLDMVRLAGALQRSLGKAAIGFHRLFINPDGKAAADISIGRLAGFLTEAHPGT